ncbi:hypothetical protein LQV63_15710 [Paenibacillus profundus]|uniref:Uncharacterized protein n=1 Tax=Paenibacillus profundus TaxID=1173085 RepID=A0ABS8YKH0_9BACL|nr:hypothetical protein [Paenibacillus profundus]MCE5170752.1 hypothetical protein [Paenibacillus profundus]
MPAEPANSDKELPYKSASNVCLNTGEDQLIQMKLSTRCNSGIGGFFVCRLYGVKGTEVTQIVSMYSVDVLA